MVGGGGVWGCCNVTVCMCMHQQGTQARQCMLKFAWGCGQRGSGGGGKGRDGAWYDHHLEVHAPTGNPKQADAFRPAAACQCAPASAPALPCPSGQLPS